MRRDMDLVREILLAAESLPAAGGFIDLPERDDGELRYHLRIVAQAGLLDVQFAAHEGTAHETVWLNGLTWQGHEFLSTARDNTRWRAAVHKVGATAGGVAFALLRDYLLSEARKLVGIAPS